MNGTGSRRNEIEQNKWFFLFSMHLLPKVSSHRFTRYFLKEYIEFQSGSQWTAARPFEVEQ